MYSYISENNFGPSKQITVSTSYNSVILQSAPRILAPKC